MGNLDSTNLIVGMSATFYLPLCILRSRNPNRHLLTKQGILIGCFVRLENQSLPGSCLVAASEALLEFAKAHLRQIVRDVSGVPV